MDKKYRGNNNMAKSIRLNSKVKQAIANYIKHLQKMGINIQKAYLFGSFVKNDNSKWSDIDLCLISPQFESENEVWELLWQNRQDEDIDVILSPIGFHPDDFVDEDPLGYEIKNSGIEINI